jgi:hypothetical protein
MTILVEQDRTSELDAMAHHLLESEYRPWFQEGYAYALVMQGRYDDAAALLEGQLPPLIDSWMHLGVLGGGCCVRAALGDVAGATVLGEHLAPFAGRLATAGTGPAFGDVHGALSVVARVQGDIDGARNHADRSVEVLRRAGAGPFLARALLLRADLQPASASAAADDDRRLAAELIERLDLRLLRRQQRDGTLQVVSK